MMAAEMVRSKDVTNGTRQGSSRKKQLNRSDSVHISRHFRVDSPSGRSPAVALFIGRRHLQAGSDSVDFTRCDSFARIWSDGEYFSPES